MKKIILSLLSMMCLLATSCSNDDIVIESNGTLEYTVNISNLYKTFDMEDEIQDAIRDKEYCITVTNLIYDNESGSLVKEIQSTAFALNNIKESIELNDGSYTIISIQSIGDPNKEGKHIKWEISDKEKISSVYIKPTARTYYTNAIGVSTQNIQVKGKTSVTATTKAIGSLVTLYYCNFDNSDYTNLGFFTKDITTKYLFDPSLSREEKFIVDLAASGKINIRDKRENNWEAIEECTLYLLEKKIDYSFCVQSAENSGSTTWTNWPSNEKTAYLEDGEWYHAGAYFMSDDVAFSTVWANTRQEVADWYNTCITLLIPTTYQIWGGTVANVQAFMNDYEMIMGDKGYAAPSTNNTYEIQYKGKGKEEFISYSFSTPTTGLTEVDIFYDTSKVAFDNLNDELMKSYTFILESDGTYMYSSTDMGTYILLFKHEDFYCVGYVDASLIAGTKSRTCADYKEILKRHIASKKQ